MAVLAPGGLMAGGRYSSEGTLGLGRAGSENVLSFIATIGLIILGQSRALSWRGGWE